MSMASICAQVDADNRAAVMAETWGHLEARDMKKHYGWFTFIHGQHGDMVVLESDFPTFGEGPGYFDDRQEFIWRKVKDGGPCSEVGLYRFDGYYKMYAKASSVSEQKMIGYFVGKVQRLRHEPLSMPKLELDYWRHSFRIAARRGDTIGIHATRCQSLHKLFSELMRTKERKPAVIAAPRQAAKPPKETAMEKEPYSVVGTSHYRSEEEARRAYPIDYLRAIHEGRISIGKPDLKPGQRLKVDREGRYHIATGEEPK